VKPDPRRNQLRDFLAKRVFSFGVVLAVAFLLLVSLALSTALAAAGDLVTGRLGAPALVLVGANWVVSFVVIAALFAAMFKLLPDARIRWRDVRAGAVGTALLFVLGKSAIGLYLGRTDPGSAYGAAGSLAIVLIWLYYSSMIVLFGAELTRQWTERYGGGVRPEQGAVEVVEQEVEVQRG
jgi:membrane protein